MTVDTSAKLHELNLRVYWEDTDAGGIIYHASYVRFMERGRTEFLRECGIIQSELYPEFGVRFVVSKLNVSYLAPGFLDNLLIVRTRCANLGHARLVINQSVRRDGLELVRAEVICAALNNDDRPVRLPDQVRQKILAMQESDT